MNPCATNWPPEIGIDWHHADNWLAVMRGDWIEQLRMLPDGSVHCCVTSPPYWGLRDYGVPGQLGLERTPEEYVAKIMAGFREVRRVLRDDGTLWLNLGDSYTSGGRGEQSRISEGQKQATNRGSSGFRSWRPDQPFGLKPKDLVGIPWRVAFALQADGWYLRSDIIWSKPNPMPESVTDRPTKSHEYIFLLSKRERYFYDSEAVKEPQSNLTLERIDGYRNRSHQTTDSIRWKHVSESAFGDKAKASGKMQHRIEEGGRNKRTVWTVPSQGYPESHFATFPEDLIKPCILAGTSAHGCCPKCGAPWEREVEKSGGTIGKSWHDHKNDLVQGQRSDAPSLKSADYGNGEYQVKTLGWKPTCSCGETQTVPCTVLDPFAGSGTTGQVALELGRKAILIELNPKYAELIKQRTSVTPGLQLA